MKHHSILIQAITILILGSLHGCTDKDPHAVTDDENTGRKTQAVNLFPKESFAYSNTGKLSLDEAFIQSKQVIRTTYLKQIDNSNTRSIKPFYIYQVDEGSFEKSVNTGKNKFPILFLSKEELFKGKALQDSVYLFLAPLQGYEILQKNMGIKYKWVDDAPFLRQEN